jgi:hypothetical protein
LALVLPALIEGMYILTGAACALMIAGVALLRRRPASRWSDILLIAESIVAMFVVLSGAHPTFGILAFSLQLGAWNIGHRFGHLETAAADRDAIARVSLRLLLFSLLSSLVVSVIVTVFLYVRMPMTFTIGLGLALCVLLLLVLFVRFAWSARRDRDAS